MITGKNEVIKHHKSNKEKMPESFGPNFINSINNISYNKWRKSDINPNQSGGKHRIVPENEIETDSKNQNISEIFVVPNALSSSLIVHY